MGLQQCHQSGATRQKHLRTKSYIISYQNQSQYRREHHSQVKRTYIAQTAGDIDFVASIPTLVDEKYKNHSPDGSHDSLQTKELTKKSSVVKTINFVIP